MTFETAFKRLKTKFENVDATVLGDMAFQITLTDEDSGGTFYTQIKSNALSVEPYDYKDNDAVIAITRKSLAAILDGKSSFDKVIENGEATIAGDLDKFEAFKNSIKPPAPVSKTKAVPKKSETAKKK